MSLPLCRGGGVDAAEAGVEGAEEGEVLAVLALSVGATLGGVAGGARGWAWLPPDATAAAIGTATLSSLSLFIGLACCIHYTVLLVL